VTRVQFVLTLAAFEDAGTLHGDRVEHGSLIPAELIPNLAHLGVTVVTNPGLVFDRGDEYVTDVEPSDRPDLYRCRSLIAANVGVAAGSDAPFGPDDPWAVARAAVTRSTRSGRSIGADERIDARSALSLFLGWAEDPTTQRVVSVGAPGDLCVLATPLREALRSLDSGNVAATVVAGAVVADNR
jgi:predicted amidohydrolase YtcJ